MRGKGIGEVEVRGPDEHSKNNRGEKHAWAAEGGSGGRGARGEWVAPEVMWGQAGGAGRRAVACRRAGAPASVSEAPRAEVIDGRDGRAGPTVDGTEERTALRADQPAEKTSRAHLNGMAPPSHMMQSKSIRRERDQQCFKRALHLGVQQPTTSVDDS